MRDHDGRIAEPAAGESLELPAPTAAPMITALGITLIGAGLLTNAAVSIVGGTLALAGAVGWWRAVLPFPKVERISVLRRGIAPMPEAPQVERVQRPVAIAGSRLRLPIEVPPFSAGITGGIAGGVAMAAVALAYGLLAEHSLWYPINLLAAAGLPNLATASTSALCAFDGAAFFVALLAHGTISLLVGLLYVLILPMLPRRHLLWGGLVAPLLWTGVVWAVLGIVNPVLDARIDWLWFVASQIAFGLVAGLVVARTPTVGTPQTGSVPGGLGGAGPSERKR
ncbi:MAG TPA: hypothetical protein DEP35_20080 [Deltaproteobacteria bacterium]|nr:hypothetical protein [Deltaproteobacteria bacterium]